MLYDYFKTKFLQKVKEFGHEKLVYEKEEMRKASERTLKRCTKQNVEPDCEYLNKPEISFINEIRKRQHNKSLQIIFDRILNVGVKRMDLNRPKVQDTLSKLKTQIKRYFYTRTHQPT